MVIRIDAHQHYWKIQRGDYGWITPEIPVLYRDFLPTDLAPELQHAHIDGTILVQAAPTLEETDYMLSLADGEDSVVGVVGWLDLSDPDHFRHFEKHRLHPKYKGFRIMIQDMPDARGIVNSSFIEALRIYEGLDVPVDLLLTSRQLEPLVELLSHVPKLRGVIDHIAKPDISGGEMESWHRQMSIIAGYPGIRCKLSGMVTEADHDSWTPSDFIPYVQSVIALFGEDRVLFGSDWPVCLLAADYRQVVDVLEQSLPQGWTPEANAKLFGLNAAEFYKL